MSDTQGFPSTYEEPVSRRKVVKKAVVAAALGTTGASVLIGAMAPSASATGEKGALLPRVVFLADATTVVVDASLGNDFRLTLEASRTIANPSRGADGQKIIFQITQGGDGSNTVTWGDLYEFSTSLPRPALSTHRGETDLLGFIYNKAKGRWLFAAFVNGFS